MKWAALAVLATCSAIPVYAAPPASVTQAPLPAGRAYVPGELIVQYKASAPESSKVAALRKGGARSVERLRGKLERRDGKGDLARFRLAAGTRVDRALLDRLRNDPAIEYVEPNWIYRSQLANPNDPGLSLLWGVQGAASSPSHPYGSGALAAWNAGARCASSVHVGVIDTGVMLGHPDLRTNIWLNRGEGSRVNQRDNDRNGYVDDIHGWDFANERPGVFTGVDDTHGTHVAGIIAAAANNRIGTLGVCPTARLITAKFLQPVGGTTADAIRAIQYLTRLKQAQRLHLVAVNASWGGAGDSQALREAIRAAGEQNILFIAAAGNEGRDIDQYPTYPASIDLPNVITVAAMSSRGGLASFSNYGARSVELAAPGEDIASTVPLSATRAGYAYLSGTSMAAPHVSGAAALYASLNPCASAAQIRTALLRSAVRDPQLVGLVQEGRRLDVSRFRKELACRR